VSYRPLSDAMNWNLKYRQRSRKNPASFLVFFCIFFFWTALQQQIQNPGFLGYYSLVNRVGANRKHTYPDLSACISAALHYGILENSRTQNGVAQRNRKALEKRTALKECDWVDSCLHYKILTRACVHPHCLFHYRAVSP